jgi:hypothetical protein
MVGRIELITPAQRKTLAQFSSVKSPAAPLDQWYGTLGRFRAALLIDELRRNPNPRILGFVASRGIPPAALGITAPAAPAAAPATQPVSAGNGATPPLVLLKR